MVGTLLSVQDSSCTENRQRFLYNREMHQTRQAGMVIAQQAKGNGRTVNDTFRGKLFLTGTQSLGSVVVWCTRGANFT